METTPDTTQQLWRTEFDKQYTREMLSDLVKRTIALTKRYERFTPRKSTDTPEDRINTAIMKLFAGKRIWDPARVDLAGFLAGVISSGLSAEMRRSKLAPTVPLGDPALPREDDYTGEECDESNTTERRAPIEDGWNVPAASESVDEAWSLAMTHLRELAATDRGVLALLDAYEDGVIQKRDVIARLGWSPATYKRVYQRLLLLADAADPAVREAIMYAFAN
jgi:hypothetical protein